MEAKDSHMLCPACQHEYGYHDKEGHCHKGCCGCGSDDHHHNNCST
ncbi:hypothetical protein [Nitrososphaera viennensis]|uniref:Uncharacterized protein n=2 Tax=Nitrososphaera viennensis TaxID=1034015 RepID=A0A060HFF3_9ARCH|nr:hypothetical protein [Nitrososphaera viennensis]AIC15349.1 hypothetical protein NVIE_011190 [Nitrososphaera viennensis EN76]UVS70248.1 hypothetical protein NWT39_05530 [Nitrososphaera viennensis]